MKLINFENKFDKFKVSSPAIPLLTNPPLYVIKYSEKAHSFLNVYKKFFLYTNTKNLKNE